MERVAGGGAIAWGYSSHELLFVFRHFFFVHVWHDPGLVASSSQFRSVIIVLEQ